jgi:hypothetical protein
MSREEPWRWSEPWAGMPGMTPAQYVRIGTLLAIEPIITQKYREMSNASSGPASDIDELEAKMAELRQEVQMDFSGGYDDGDVDLTGYAYEPAADRVDASYGPGVSDRLRERGAGRMIGAMAREVGRQAARRGDIYEMCEIYAETGISGSGHAIDLANQPGSDSFQIELARYEGDLPGLCGRPDSFGGCSERYHASSCAHNVQAAASRAATPADAGAWQGVLHSRSQEIAVDSEGRAFRNGQGEIANMSDHFRASSGIRPRRSVFEPGPKTATNPGPMEKASIQPADPGFSRSTRAAARAFAAQAGMRTSADDARQREASRAGIAGARADLDRRTAGRVHPDYSGETMRERAERVKAQAQARPALQFSNYAEDVYGEDVFSATCGSLGRGVGGF